MYDRSDNAGLPPGSVGKESACNAGDPSSIPGSGRSTGEGIGYPFQHSGLENSMDCIGLSNFHFTDGEFGFGHVESFNHFREEGSWLVNIQFLT